MKEPLGGGRTAYPHPRSEFRFGVRRLGDGRYEGYSDDVPGLTTPGRETAQQALDQIRALLAAGWIAQEGPDGRPLPMRIADAAS